MPVACGEIDQYCGSIRSICGKDICTIHYPVDLTVVQYLFDRKFRVIIDNGEDISTHQRLDPMLTVCYTDGSSIPEVRSGAGIYYASTQERGWYSLGRHCTAFQAETFAITSCACTLLHSHIADREIIICTDSQAVLKALCAPSTRYRSVVDAVAALNDLARNNLVFLQWVRGHSGILGNEIADGLAKQGASTPFIGPEPAVGCTMELIHQHLQRWARKRQIDMWRETPGCRQAKALLSNSSLTSSRYLLRLSRKELQLVVGLLCGHAPVAYHLFNMRLISRPTCPSCGEDDDETTEHFMCSCPAFATLRKTILGNTVLSLTAFRELALPDVVKFIRLTERFK